MLTPSTYQTLHSFSIPLLNIRLTTDPTAVQEGRGFKHSLREIQQQLNVMKETMHSSGTPTQVSQVSQAVRILCTLSCFCGTSRSAANVRRGPI